MQKVKTICKGIDCLNIYYFVLIVKVAFALKNLCKAGCPLAGLNLALTNLFIL